MPSRPTLPAIAPPYRKFVVSEDGGIVVGEVIDDDHLFVASHWDLAASLVGELATAGWILIRDDALVGIVQDGEGDDWLPLGQLALEQWAIQSGSTIRVVSALEEPAEKTSSDGKGREESLHQGWGAR